MAERCPSPDHEYRRSSERHFHTLDLSEWHACQSPVRSDLLAHPLRDASLQTGHRYFLVLAMAGNLFTGTGYFLFSGVFNFGDWATVIRGLQPHWRWQVGLVVLGLGSYYASMLVVAASMKPFQRKDENSRRLRALCWTPYFTDGTLAGIGALFNPLGLFYVLASALPSTLGANAGMLSLPGMIRRPSSDGEGQVEPIRRNLIWIATSAVGSLFFILVLGRGITWSMGLPRSMRQTVKRQVTVR